MAASLAVGVADEEDVSDADTAGVSVDADDAVGEDEGESLVLALEYTDTETVALAAADCEAAFDSDAADDVVTDAATEPEPLADAVSLAVTETLLKLDNDGADDAELPARDVMLGETLGDAVGVDAMLALIVGDGDGESVAVSELAAVLDAVTVCDAVAELLSVMDADVVPLGVTDCVDIVLYDGEIIGVTVVDSELVSDDDALAVEATLAVGVSEGPCDTDAVGELEPDSELEPVVVTLGVTDGDGEPDDDTEANTESEAVAAAVALADEVMVADAKCVAESEPDELADNDDALDGEGVALGDTDALADTDLDRVVETLAVAVAGQGYGVESAVGLIVVGPSTSVVGGVESGTGANGAPVVFVHSLSAANVSESERAAVSLVPNAAAMRACILAPQTMAMSTHVAPTATFVEAVAPGAARAAVDDTCAHAAASAPLACSARRRAGAVLTGALSEIVAAARLPLLNVVVTVRMRTEVGGTPADAATSPRSRCATLLALATSSAPDMAGMVMMTTACERAGGKGAAARARGYECGKGARARRECPQQRRARRCAPAA